MRLQILLIVIFSFLFFGCSSKPLTPVEYDKIDRNLSYSKDVKPILDKRCVSCHSCYNSPCQLKLESFEGLDRGASKALVYDTRLRAADPTRLFIDAKTTEDWRKKEFSSVIDKNLDNNESIMMQYLFQKELNPELIGNYSPETDEISCVKNQEELEDYFDDNPHKAMPYGFPALSKNEYNILMNWLDNGLTNDTKKNVINNFEKEQIKKFEDFLNNPSIKHQVTARYIYEHLFLAHIYFDEKSGHFFEIIRSKTAAPFEPEIIPTVFPYDKIDEKFYYRIQKFEQTIVHKTHMPFKIDDKKLKLYNELFINRIWDEKPYMPSYDKTKAPNALEIFKQIPADSRYKFLLEDVYFIINNFIKGPVCKGQIALNVIQDHFWVAFMDPKYDLSIRDNFFLRENLHNLEIPNQLGEDPTLYKTFKNLNHEKEIRAYNKNKEEIYNKYYPNGMKLEYLRKSPNNDSILTVYKHFDTASLHKGALGSSPKTMWVIDFPLLERIYYSLVAGFDVFGNTAHQLLVRTHMDRLRVEGESNFLEFLPKNSRQNYFNSWYIGWLAQYITIYSPSNNETAIKYSSSNYKEELISKILKYTNTKEDKINYIYNKDISVDIRNSYKNKKEIEEGFRSLSLPNKQSITKYFTDREANTALIKIELNNGENLIYSMVINRWHDNVALMFKEEDRLDPSKDDIDFIEGFISSYPNIFLIVKQNEFQDFLNAIKRFNNSDTCVKNISKFAINRANPKFWEIYDWFTEEFRKSNPLEFGLFDLNRYHEKAIIEED
ncbi:fatty acid cis/trans isomerase [Aliarcobacter thereius]|uniref:Fatty acid cis/trans isomerase (CTI) n=2 Tax=Aliarcobacter thereius TaxID=544718 RepID=A0A1C7WNG8_9BACT|nr:fatty acid cis/trans isomerase [Aliarcobacter thereius]OCL95310.1 Fatty acid cis/trans isomerase (CTI) [Aliarcobacter thereius LMG 24486]QBF16701.1 fatty acid cis/trans isomerase [Aliarcobacter thereius LMG 24486]